MRNDHAFTARDPKGTKVEPAFAGALSFLAAATRRTSRASTSPSRAFRSTRRRPTGPAPASGRGRSARRRSQIAWTRPYGCAFDPLEKLAVVDFGDCAWDHGRPEGIPAAIEAHADAILGAGAAMLSLGGDHFISYPLLKAHARKHGRLSLIHFDAHSDTWNDADGHGPGRPRDDVLSRRARGPRRPEAFGADRASNPQRRPDGLQRARCGLGARAWRAGCRDPKCIASSAGTRRI